MYSQQWFWQSRRKTGPVNLISAHRGVNYETAEGKLSWLHFLFKSCAHDMQRRPFAHSVIYNMTLFDWHFAVFRNWGLTRSFGSFVRASLTFCEWTRFSAKDIHACVEVIGDACNVDFSEWASAGTSCSLFTLFTLTSLLHRWPTIIWCVDSPWRATSFSEIAVILYYLWLSGIFLDQDLTQSANWAEQEAAQWNENQTQRMELMKSGYP